MPLNHKTRVAGAERSLETAGFTGLKEAGLYTTAAPRSFSPVEAYLVHFNKQETEFGPTLSYMVSAPTFIYISFP